MQWCIEARQRDRAFEEKYVECLEARERGEDVVFPAGTWAHHPYCSTAKSREGRARFIWFSQPQPIVHGR